MKNNKNTKLHRSTEVMSHAKSSKWCYVDINNEFKFNNQIFRIDESVSEYKVHNKAQFINGVLNDFTNESYMEEVLAVIDMDGKLSFYNQNYERLGETLVLVKE